MTISACLLAFSILCRDALTISNTQFCRVDQALSNDMSFHLSRAKASRKSTERTRDDIFGHFCVSIVGISHHWTFADQQEVVRL